MTAVFAWGLANESGFCEIFLPVARFLYNTDKKRFIYSAGERCVDYAGYHQQPFKDIIVNNYLTADSEHYPERILPDPDKIRETLPRFPHKPMPMFYTESAHVFCNRDNFMLDPGLLGEPYGCCLHKAFQAFKQCKYVGGFFVFEWSDQAVMQKGDPELSDSFIGEWRGYATFNQNLKGLIGPNHEPKPAYYHLKKVYSQIVIKARVATAEKLILEISNNYYWRDLKTFDITVAVSDGDKTITPSERIENELAAGEKGEYEINLPGTGKGNCYTVQVTDPFTGVSVERRNIWYKPVPWKGYSLSFKSVNIVKDKGNLIKGLEAGDKVLNFVRFLDLTLGQIPDVVKNRKIGMGHLDELPQELENVVSDGSIIEIKDTAYQETGEEIQFQKKYILKEGQISCSYYIKADKKIRIKQEIEYDGQDVSTIQLGMKFSLPSYYRQLAWLRQGLWQEYPTDHPDQLTGEIVLEEMEFPAVNTFRYPAFSELFTVRGIEECLLTGEHVPGLYIKSLNKGQKVIVKSRPDHSWDIYLALETYGTLPYHEFSFNTQARAEYGTSKHDIREAYQGVKQLKPGEVIVNDWEIGLTD